MTELPQRLTADQKARMERLSLAIIDLCDDSGLRDGLLIANAAIIGLASVIAGTLPDNATETQIAGYASSAGLALSAEIVRGQKQFLCDMAALKTSQIQ